MNRKYAFLIACTLLMGLTPTMHGQTGTSCLGNQVFNDLNFNNVRDAGEPDVAGVTVHLISAQGDELATLETNNLGRFKFCSLDAGMYKLKYDLPAGFGSFVTPYVGGFEYDSNVDQTGLTELIDLPAGQTRLTFDAGVSTQGASAAGCIGNQVFNDLNFNDIRDAGEPDVPGVTVHLLSSEGVELATLETNNLGRFKFCDLAAGTYMLKYDLPNGFESFVTPYVGGFEYDSNVDENGLTDAITLATGQVRLTFDAGVRGQGSVALGCIGNQLFDDLNYNSTRDEGEPNVAGVTVHLLNAEGGVITTLVTDETGIFKFCNLAAGKYFLKYDLPAGYASFVTPFVGDFSYDSNVDENGKTDEIILLPGKRRLTFDAGVWQTLPNVGGCIGNLLFHDLNRNGIRNAGEPGVGDTYVQLETPNQEYITHMYTNPDGSYEFCDLPAGDYVIKFTLPPGFPRFSNQNQASDDNIDSDAHYLLGRTAVITLAPGQVIDNIDAGIISTKLGLCPEPVTATVSNITCDGSDNFTFDITATGGSDMGWNCNGTLGNVYGTATNVGSFPLDYGSITLTVFNAQYSNCFYNFTVWAPTCFEAAPVGQNNIAAPVYPNPANNSVFVNTSSFGNKSVTVTVYDAFGRVISEQKVQDASESTIEFNTSQWPIGIYSIRTFNNELGQVATRLVIQR